jgi:hypothetical protein
MMNFWHTSKDRMDPQCVLILGISKFDYEVARTRLQNHLPSSRLDDSFGPDRQVTIRDSSGRGLATVFWLTREPIERLKGEIAEKLQQEREGGAVIHPSLHHMEEIYAEYPWLKSLATRRPPMGDGDYNRQIEDLKRETMRELTQEFGSVVEKTLVKFESRLTQLLSKQGKTDRDHRQQEPKRDEHLPDRRDPFTSGGRLQPKTDQGPCHQQGRPGARDPFPNDGPVLRSTDRPRHYHDHDGAGPAAHDLPSRDSTLVRNTDRRSRSCHPSQSSDQPHSHRRPSDPVKQRLADGFRLDFKEWCLGSDSAPPPMPFQETRLEKKP